MYTAIYNLFSSALFDGALTALQANTLEVVATLATLLVGLLPLYICVQLIFIILKI